MVQSITKPHNMIVTFIFLALVILILPLDRSWSNMLSPSRNELVFEGRIREYGAYQLRRESHRSLMAAMVIVAFLISVIVVFVSRRDSHPGGNVIVPSEDQPALPQLVLPKPAPTQEEMRTAEQSQNPAPRGDNQAPPEVVESGPVSSMTASFAMSNPSGTADGVSDEWTGPTEMPTAAHTESCPGGVDWASVMPEFPGGSQALKRFLSERIEYPAFYRERGIEGTVWITFVVTSSGEVTQVAVERGIVGAPGLDKIALLVFEEMPRWIPGRMGEQTVAVRQRLPVRFKLM